MTDLKLKLLATLLPDSAREGYWYVHEEMGNASIRVKTSEHSYYTPHWFYGPRAIAEFICAARNSALELSECRFCSRIAETYNEFADMDTAAPHTFCSSCHRCLDCVGDKELYGSRKNR